MTTYYVGPSGSDSNNGLGSDASHASNKPWLTIGKALGAAGIASGDTVYIGPGTYREVVTVAMTSAVAETQILGDPTNAQGFKTSAGVLLTGGDVIWTAFTTNDATTPSTSSTCNLAGRDFLTFKNIIIVGGNVSTSRSCIDGVTTTHSVNITLRQCMFVPGNPGCDLIGYASIADTAANWLIDRCIFAVGASVALRVTLVTSASADYDSNFVIQNSQFIGSFGFGVFITASGAGSFKGGGVDVLNCTFISDGTLVSTNNANLSTSIPCTVTNCILDAGSSTALSGNAASQLTEDYNKIFAGTPRNANVAVGTNSNSTNAYAMLLEFGQAFIVSERALRPFGVPVAGSPLLGFGNGTGGGNAAPVVDIVNRPRPAGGGSATTSAPITGTATAGAGSTMTDSGKSWTTNEWAGYTLRLTGGTGSGQQRYITSNTGTVLTVSTAWATNPDNTSTYTIDNSGKYAAIGAYERHDAAAQETSTTQTGSSAIKIIGPGDHDFVIPVDASSTTISIYARYDSSHGTGSKPQIVLLTNASIGVTTETKTMTSAADTWEQLSFAAQTPSAKGFVTVRCVSRAAAGQGVAYFDTMAGGASGTNGLDYFRNGEPLPALVAGGSGGGLKQVSGMDGGMRG